jgi:hypothetical protein
MWTEARYLPRHTATARASRNCTVLHLELSGATAGDSMDLLPLSRYSITLIWALLSAIVILASIYLCDGRLIYTLDDPYIHLKVAQTILRGCYGPHELRPCGFVISTQARVPAVNSAMILMVGALSGAFIAPAW